MSSLARTRSTQALPIYTTVLAWLLAAACVAILQSGGQPPAA